MTVATILLSDGSAINCQCGDADRHIIDAATTEDGKFHLLTKSGWRECRCIGEPYRSRVVSTFQARNGRR